MSEKEAHCSFCGLPQGPELPLIAGEEGHICEECVRLASQVVGSWGRKRAAARPMQKLLKPAELKERLDHYVIGQELAKETLAVAIYNHYKRLNLESDSPQMGSAAHQDVEVEKSNILLLGPSGTGKTLLASTLARIVGVPFAIADATTLTQAGYVGEDVDSIVSRLLDSAEGNTELAEWGIVYIDEIDKLARAGESSHGTRDVSGEGVQQALLKLVEGTRVKLNAKTNKSGNEQVVDTRNILFICGGAFAGLEKLLEKRLDKREKGIGFHVDLTDPQTGYEACRVFEQVQPDDLRHFGLIPEFIGRFPIITALHDLDEQGLVRILTEPRNALARQYQRLFEFERVELTFTDKALLAIAHKAIERGTGARGLRGVLESLLRKTMYELPSLDNIAGCVVEEDTVLDEQPPRLVGREAAVESCSG
jgi:ATP-dependent Clp protease ATP-binding subunit ClpX